MRGRPLLFVILISSLLLAACGVGQERRKEADVHYILGVSYLREKNPTQALKEFLLAAELDPDNPETQNGLGQAYQYKKAYAEAERHYLRALKLSGDAPQFQSNLAALYLDMERWDDAIRYFRKAAGNLLFENPEIPLTGMCSAYLQKAEYLEAAAACNDALRHNQRYAPAHIHLGEAYYALGKYEVAVAEFQEAIRISPDAPLAHYKQGQAYMKQSQQAKAAAAFREVLRLAPDTELGRSAAEHLKILK